MITERNMVFANPQAYRVFPQIGNPYNTGITDTAIYEGYLQVTDLYGTTKSFSSTNTIDFTGFLGTIDIDLYTDIGSVKLGRWLIPQSIVITNDITITVTPIAEVSSDGATITPQCEVKHNTYHNGELTESTVITPDNITLQSNVEWITISNNQIVVAANTNTEARQGQVTIQVSYQEYNTSANYNIIQAGYSIEDGIMDAMILWYDLAKQGATNESMTTTPTLIDHSGNGHDATCYNFAWSGMSGVGGYKTDYTRYFKYSNRATIEVTDAKIVVTSISVSGTAFIETVDTDLGLIPAYKIKVSGIPDGTMLRYAYFLEESNSVKQFYDMRSDGEYELPANTYLDKNVGFLVPNFTGECNLTIEQLPLYPNALVSDGVDDYCLVEGLPLLNKEDGYTVIAKRKWLQDINRNALVSRNAIWETEESGGIDGAFNIECNTAMCYSFGQGTSLVFNNLDGFTYQTSKSYNGKDLAIGDREDNNHLCIAAINKGTTWFSSIAIYSLLLFNRDLTQDEIEWVKTNLIETEQ